VPHHHLTDFFNGKD